MVNKKNCCATYTAELTRNGRLRRYRKWLDRTNGSAFELANGGKTHYLSSYYLGDPHNIQRLTIKGVITHTEVYAW